MMQVAQIVAVKPNMSDKLSGKIPQNSSKFLSIFANSKHLCSLHFVEL